jgi:hypothetical protein
MSYPKNESTWRHTVFYIYRRGAACMFNALKTVSKQRASGGCWSFSAQ